MSPLSKASFISLFLALIKLAAFISTNSMVILASFFDSLADSAISFMNNRVEKLARQGPDREHPFGHGGFEVISSLVQGLVICFSGLVIVMQAVQRLMAGRSVLEGDKLGYGIFVVVLSAFGGAILSKLLLAAETEREKKRDRSLSLAADKAHYLGDFLANLLGAVGLLAVWYTGWVQLDSIFGILGALMLIKVAVPIIRKSLNDILHAEIDPILQKQIVDIILATDSRIKGVHRLRSRGLGPSRFVDFHMKLPTKLSLEEAHHIGETVTRTLKREIPYIDVIIHLDPANEPDDDLWQPSY